MAEKPRSERPTKLSRETIIANSKLPWEILEIDLKII